MHLNPFHPNIFHDMQAAANGRDLRDGQKMIHPTAGYIMTIPTAKRHLIPRKSYPYASERKVKRQQRKISQWYTKTLELHSLLHFSKVLGHLRQHLLEPSHSKTRMVTIATV